MGDPKKVSGTVPGTEKIMSFETGKLAPQSQGAVIASIGNTTVLATANAAKGVRDGIDFFPLTVDVEERAYAAGKIPGSFFRREGRPTEAAILTCRLTDRPLRPAFADGYRNETQVVITVIGADQENPHDVLAINAASAAFMLSGIPFEGPIGAVRLAYSQEGTWIPHPTYEEGENSTFELVVAGRQLDSGDVAVMMVEAGGTAKAYSYYEGGAPKVTEAVIADGLEACKPFIKQAIQLQADLVKAAGAREPLKYTPVLDYGDDVFAAVEKSGSKALGKAITIAAKHDRNEATDAATADVLADLAGEGKPFAGREKEIKEAVRSLTKKLVRKRVVKDGIRLDGRGPADLRAVTAEVGVLHSAHGSALFQRGETQVMNVATLGMPRMNQLLDTLSPETNKRFLHHYNMAPWANGETGRVGSPKRREIGHGALAERALLPIVPSQEEFAYTLRLVSEVLASNGSTSMGSVCSASLALMDAGVPTKGAVAGIAMGLILDEGKYITLTDILGAEDAFGDMDFKVAGTEDFITALQLDTKIDGIPADVLTAALLQARDARMAILKVMNEALAAPRDEVGETAPKIISFQIPIDKIGEVIGPKGKVINAMQQETGADIAVDDDGVMGTVTIGSTDSSKVAEARRQIELIINPPLAKVGEVYPGRVVNITKFGAFVNILPGRDGLVHISKLGKGKRINNVEDAVSLGDEIMVRVEDIDPQGKVSLTPSGPEWEVAGGSDDAADERAPRARGNDRGDRAPRAAAPAAASDSGSAPVAVASFEDAFDAEARETFGDLGPGGPAGGNDSGSKPAGGARDGGGRGRGPRRHR
jgi:polyribonucleotide nucleotidyltransferase